MPNSPWRARAGTTFQTEKHAVRGRAVVTTNHPLATAAGIEMLAAGGNAIDAAVAALFTLTIVEPMMVGILGGGMAHIRLADGRHTILDGLSTAPAAARPDIYTPSQPDILHSLETVGRANAVGAAAVGVPGTLLGWCQALERFGTASLADAMAPAIRHARHGFAVTPYLSACIAEAAADLQCDPALANLLLPDGAPLPAGTRLVQAAAAETLSVIAREGPQALYHGSLGTALVDHLRRQDGLLSATDLQRYVTIDRTPVRGHVYGHEIVGPPPPSSGGVHVIQMLKILAHKDLATLGFGTPASLHAIIEALKIAFADRASATADPAFVAVPVERLIADSYAAERAAQIDATRAQSWTAGVSASQSPHTTHVTVADASGNVVSSTQTINSLFGARFLVPELGLIPNNYMYLFDPRPGRTGSVAPGKRVTTSMAPLMVLKDGRPVVALGLPGGLRIFGSAMQAVVNLLVHGMSLQEAVEAPRVWSQGDVVEVEDRVPEAVRTALAAMGHRVVPVAHVAGGMNAIAFDSDGQLTGAACWRADGTPMALSGGRARAGTRFWPEATRG